MTQSRASPDEGIRAKKMAGLTLKELHLVKGVCMFEVVVHILGYVVEYI